MDVLAQLSDQHRHIEVLLARARGEEPGALAELADYVALHLAVEQQVLYPCVASRLSSPVVAELYAEHAEIRRVLAELVWIGGDRRWSQLAELLEGHAAWQDRELFERLAETMSQAALGDLTATIRAGLASMTSLAA
jgi:hypothetical protein